jgi:methylenetetrahydrofolate reductase (NADPH)
MTMADSDTQPAAPPRLDDLLRTRPLTVSFEFFPPKTDVGGTLQREAIKQLALHGPDFTSVTYGAGGSTQARTGAIAQGIQDEHGIPAVAHFTCVNATRVSIAERLDDYHARGIRTILALRGDPPQGEERFVPTDGGPAYATELIDYIVKDGRFAVVSSAYPEGHVQAASRTADWDRLVQKFDLGCCATITQCFFSVSPYVEMMDYVRRHHPQARVIPGILPIVDYHGMKRFCDFCGAIIPEHLQQEVGTFADDPVVSRKKGIAFTIRLCEELLQAGAPGLHIYTLNKSTAAGEVVTALRLKGLLD